MIGVLTGIAVGVVVAGIAVFVAGVFTALAIDDDGPSGISHGSTEDFWGDEFDQ